MLYPKAECCPFNEDESVKLPMDDESSNEEPDRDTFNCQHNSDYDDQCTLLKKIQEICFAVIDLNLFLDTHPENKEALELFTKLSSTLKSMESDYQSMYGPLYASETPGTTPFMWVDDDYKWPWQM